MTLHVTTLKANTGQDPTQLIFAHGWGQTGAAFSALAQSLNPIATAHLLDLPGFGQTPPPSQPWDTADYANALAEWLDTLPRGKKIWIGHSFGGRIGLRMAALHPDKIDALILIGSAGLPRKRKFHQKLLFKARIYAFKALKPFFPEGKRRDSLRKRFGSADYLNAGNMRETLIKTIREDQTSSAATIQTPTLIICGQNDLDAPPDISTRLHKLIKNSTLHILDGYDHYNILTDGRHQLARLIKPLI